jgi:hypothetical protein
MESLESIATAVADELEGRGREGRLRAQRADFNAFIRGGASWPSARGDAPQESGGQPRDEAGRFEGFDQGSRGGPGKPATNGNGWLNGLLGRGQED